MLGAKIIGCWHFFNKSFTQKKTLNEEDTQSWESEEVDSIWVD